MLARILPFLTPIAIASLLAVTSCKDECSRAADCESGNVCYKGGCTALSAEYVRCDTDRDCDDSLLFACRAGRCTIRGSTVVTDGGLTSDGGDGGPRDAAPGGDATTDTGPRDALPGDATTDGPAGDAVADTGPAPDSGAAADATTGD